MYRYLFLKRASALSINSYALMLFFIGKVIAGFTFVLSKLTTFWAEIWGGVSRPGEVRLIAKPLHITSGQQVAKLALIDRHGYKMWCDIMWCGLAHHQVLPCSSIDLTQATHNTLGNPMPSHVTSRLAPGTAARVVDRHSLLTKQSTS